MLGLFLGFIFGFIGSMPLTGPIAVVVLRLAFLNQFGQARLVMVGAALAEGIYCALAMFGFDILTKKYPMTLEVIRTFSGILLIVLGIVFLRTTATASPSQDKLPSEEGFKRYILLGFTISGLNPVLLVSWATAIAMFHSLTHIEFSLLGKILFPVAVPFGIISWFSILLYLLKQHKEKLGMRVTTILVRLMSLILIIAGIGIIIKKQILL
ncbi:MAG: LysE family transporter [Leptospiraceae bacterium]|nr:LysE family transporter [Leptospiraceae bacterium]